MDPTPPAKAPDDGRSTPAPANPLRVAAVQTAPVFLDVPATIEKIRRLTREAARAGSRIVAFPEVFLAGYPYWIWLYDPIRGQRYFPRFAAAAIEVPGPETERLGEIARDHGVVLVLGVNERSRASRGTLYNTNVVFGPDGRLLGKHRKLVPTHAERLAWGHGDGSGYRVHATPFGRVGTLPCGENTNTLARFALLAQDEEVHVANFPAFPFADWYDEVEAIRIRCRAHAFEGKVFVLASTSLVDEATLQAVCASQADRDRMSGQRFALTAVYGPRGELVSEEIVDEEGIAYGDIDLGRIPAARLMHDIAGHYNQFNVLSLRVDRRPHAPLHEVEQRLPREQEDDPAVALGTTD